MPAFIKITNIQPNGQDAAGGALGLFDPTLGATLKGQTVIGMIGGGTLVVTGVADKDATKVAGYLNINITDKPMGLPLILAGPVATSAPGPFGRTWQLDFAVPDLTGQVSAANKGVASAEVVVWEMPGTAQAIGTPNDSAEFLLLFGSYIAPGIAKGIGTGPVSP